MVEFWGKKKINLKKIEYFFSLIFFKKLEDVKTKFFCQIRKNVMKFVKKLKNYHLISWNLPEISIILNKKRKTF
jgi:hypothetical protein